MEQGWERLHTMAVPRNNLEAMKEKYNSLCRGAGGKAVAPGPSKATVSGSGNAATRSSLTETPIVKVSESSIRLQTNADPSG